MKIYTQLTPPPAESEDIDVEDIACLDKASLTSVVEFMRKFQNDASFAPPTVPVEFDSDKFDVNIDSEGEFPPLFEEVEDIEPSEESKMSE